MQRVAGSGQGGTCGVKEESKNGGISGLRLARIERIISFGKKLVVLSTDYTFYQI